MTCKDKIIVTLFVLIFCQTIIIANIKKGQSHTEVIRRCHD